jgi:hypothetical protein
MDAESAFQSYMGGALEIFGINTDEAERAVMTGVWTIYEPGMDLLRDADLDGIGPERNADLSSAPKR